MKKPVPPVKPEFPIPPTEYTEKEIVSVGTYCTFSLKDLLNEIQENENCGTILTEDLSQRIFLEPITESDYDCDVVKLRVFIKIKNENYMEERKLFENIRNKYDKELKKYNEDSKKYIDWLEELADKERNKK